MRTADVVIIGAGIIGATTAYFLARAGLHVAVIERDCVGGATTACSMGHLTVLDGSDAEFDLTQRSMQLWQDWRQRLPEACDYRSCGTLWVAEDEAEWREALRKAEYFRQRGVATASLDQQALRDCEPLLAPDLLGGLLVPDDAIIYPPHAAKYFLDEAVICGASYINAEVQSIAGNTVMLTDLSVWQAAHIVVCAGNQAAELVADIPLQRKKGHLAITDRAAPLLSHQLIELGYIKNAHLTDRDSFAANIQPRPTGQTLIGSTRQFNDDTRELNWPLVQKMLQRARRFVPALSRQNLIRIWTGFRPTTPDTLPLIGRWPDNDFLWLNVGHEGLGVATSLASAELLVQLLTGQVCTLDPSAFRPERFRQAQSFDAVHFGT